MNMSLTMLHSGQIRAARALLGWRQEDLSDVSGVAIATIQRIEKKEGPVMGNVSTQFRIQHAFERAGIHFIDTDAVGGVGVRLELSKSMRRNQKHAK